MTDIVKALADSNAVAVFVAAVAAFVLGAAWYSPALFYKQWVTALGWNKARIAELRKGGRMERAMAFCFIATMLMSLAYSIVFNLLSVHGFISGASHGLFIAAGIAVTNMFVFAVYERRGRNLFYINAGYSLAMGIIIGGILGAWPK